MSTLPGGGGSFISRRFQEQFAPDRPWKESYPGSEKTKTQSAGGRPSRHGELDRVMDHLSEAPDTFRMPGVTAREPSLFGDEDI